MEREKVETKEFFELSREPAPINLHLYQPPRVLNVQFQNRTSSVFDISGKSLSFPGFNEQITEESYTPLINGGYLSNRNISWNLYGVTSDWMSINHPELISALQKQIESGAAPPVGDTYLHVIYPFLSCDHKNMLL